MRFLLLFCIHFLISIHINAQATDLSVVIVTCKSGTLIIDGNLIGQVQADDASKQKLLAGEHYLQLKTPSKNYNLTINVDQNNKGIIKLGCEANTSSEGIRLIDKQLSLSGALSSDVEQNVIGLDEGDEIILNCAVLNKKGTANISLINYSNRREIYKKQNFTNIENEKIRIPARGVYYFTLYTDALFGKNAKLTIDRIHGQNSTVDFNTSVKTVYDTTNIEILNTKTRVYSLTNANHSNKTTISINLPKNTAYWTYWIGVGQESQEAMKSFIANISDAGSLISTNPLVLFGMKIIPSLPMLNTPGTINYRFTDSRNGQLFMNGQAYNYHNFKHAKNITTDYAFIKNNIQDLVLSMDNKSMSNGSDVEVRVVAFTITSKLVLQE